MSSFPATERVTDCWCVSGYTKVAGVCVQMVPRPIQLSGTLEGVSNTSSPAEIQNATEQLRRSIAAQFNVAEELVQVDRIANSSNVQVLLFARSEAEVALQEAAAVNEVRLCREVTRLRVLLDEAAYTAPVRRATRPTRASQQRRVEGKLRRGQVKALRGRKVDGHG
jgi:hypothetical protein